MRLLMAKQQIQVKINTVKEKIKMCPTNRWNNEILTVGKKILKDKNFCKKPGTVTERCRLTDLIQMKKK